MRDDRELLEVYYPDPGKKYVIPKYVQNQKYFTFLFFGIILFFLIFSAGTMTAEEYRLFMIGAAVFTFLAYLFFTVQYFLKKPKVQDEYNVYDLIRGDFRCKNRQDAYYWLIFPVLIPVAMVYTFINLDLSSNSFLIMQGIFLLIPDLVILGFIFYKSFILPPKGFSVDDRGALTVRYYNREAYFTMKDILKIRLYNSTRYRGRSGPAGIIFFLNNGEKVKIPLNRVFSEKYGIQVPASFFEKFFRDSALGAGFHVRSTHKDVFVPDGWYTF